MPDHRTPLATAVQAGKSTDCHHSKAEFDTLFRQIAQRRDLSPVAKLVHGALVSLHRIGKSRTQVKIGEMVGLTRHQVWTGLHELAASGDILIVRIGLGQPNDYILLSIDADDLRPVRKQPPGQSGHSRARTSLPEEKGRKNVSHSGYDVAAYLAHEQATYREASKRYGVRR
jgi:hypothetical protein